MTPPAPKSGWRPRRDVTIGQISNAYWFALKIETAQRGCRMADVVEAALLKEFGPVARATLEGLQKLHGEPDGVATVPAGTEDRLADGHTHSDSIVTDGTVVLPT